jgi:hydrogenase-4 component B
MPRRPDETAAEVESTKARDVAAIAAPARPSSGLAATICGVGIVIVGCALALVPTLRVLLGGPPASLRLPWDAAHGSFGIGIDPLGAFFLLPILVLAPLAAIFGGRYMLAHRGPRSLGAFWLFFVCFVAGMASVIVAQTALVFVVAWEIMSLSAYFLVTFEHDRADVRRAGWIYLVAAHAGVAFLLVAFVLMGRRAGSLDFDAFRAMAPLDPRAAGLIFALALVGFGAKAGFVPFHVWLPEAHPAAPAPVSALMSGVMIKVGVYGLLRVVTFLGKPAPWWGLALAGVGLVTALVGISLALNQRDVKRVLAYSSIENMGLIALAAGVGLWGSATDVPAVAVLGIAAAFFHVWNHSLVKGLMFFAAGSVAHGAGTADVESLGGLLKRMPFTATLMIVGAVAIAALPPLNGFLSKWLVYLALLRCAFSSAGGPALVACFAVGFLALIGGLAAIAFARLVGIALLGSPRTAAAARAHESSRWMLGPMIVLAGLCAIVAVVPGTVVGAMSRAVEAILPRAADDAWRALESSEAPLLTAGRLDAAVLLAIAALAVAIRFASRAKDREGPTWGCGYVRPTARMQYTGRSFSEQMAEHLLPRFLRPKVRGRAPLGWFPSTVEFEADSPDPVRERVYEPFFARWAERFSRLRILQQGRIHVYLLYILVVVVLALAWVTVRGWWGAP